MKNKIIFSCFGLVFALAAFMFPCVAKANAEELPAQEEQQEQTDTEAPEIFGQNNYTISNSSLLLIEDIKNSLTIIDNVDENVDVELVSDNYTKNYKIPGSYLVRFKASDSAENESFFNVVVNVIDTQAPVFKDSYGMVITNYNIFKSLDSILVLNEVLETIKVVDDVDKKIEIKVVEDNYSGKGNKEGVYNIKLEASDKAGNTSYFDISVNVSELIPSQTIVINNKIIIVEKDVVLTNEDFAKVIKICGLYQNGTTSYTTLNTETYTAMASVIGEYVVGYEIVTTSGTTTNGSFSVKVVDDRADGSIINEDEEQSWVMRLLNKIWNIIKSFFEWLIGLFI